MGERGIGPRGTRGDGAMRYVMLIQEHADDMAERDDPAKAPGYWGGWMAYATAIRESGISVGGNGLAVPGAATVLRLRDGQRIVQDGPYADTKEQLGGYFVLEVPSVEVALDWAARCPAAARGTIELRPVLPAPG